MSIGALTTPWGSLTRRVASVLASASSESDVEEEPTNVEVDQQVAQSWPTDVNPRAQRLTPAPFGTKLCPCHGEVLVIHGHYGWLTASHKIAHQAAARNGGQVYFHVSDVVGNMSLVEGDRVDFFLYVDEQGLGAEELSLQRWDAGPSLAPVRMNPAAMEFVPKAYSTLPISALVAHTVQALVLNDAFWSDDSDSDSSAESEIDQRGYIADEVTTHRRGTLQRKQRKKSRAISHGSSSTGTPSDSECRSLDGPPPGLFPQHFRPPPGLSFAPGFRS